MHSHECPWHASLRTRSLSPQWTHCIFHKAFWNSFWAPSLLLWLCIPCLDPLPIPSPRPILCHQGGVSEGGIRRSHLRQNHQGLMHDVSLSTGRPRQAQNAQEYWGKAPKWGEIREGEGGAWPARESGESVDSGRVCRMFLQSAETPRNKPSASFFPKTSLQQRFNRKY